MPPGMCGGGRGGRAGEAFLTCPHVWRNGWGPGSSTNGPTAVHTPVHTPVRTSSSPNPPN
eukprot:282160-Chlamydomonas_euryale.AAC.10